MVCKIKDKTAEPITSPEKVAAVFQSLLKAEDKIDKDKEHFWVMHLDSRNIIKQVELISLGTVDRALIHPREVFTRAVGDRATNIIICHNHPSGDCKPSEEDIAVTDNLVKAAGILQIPILDHLIITEKSFYSLREWGVSSLFIGSMTV